MSDEEDIRRLLAEFNAALDGRRFEDWANCFTEDGSIRRVDNDSPGTRTRAGILEGIKNPGGDPKYQLATNPELHRKHTNPNITIDVRGDEARVKCDLVMYDQIGSNPPRILIGHYDDLVVKQDGRWLFASRELTMWPEPPKPAT